MGCNFWHTFLLPPCGNWVELTKKNSSYCLPFVCIFSLWTFVAEFHEVVLQSKHHQGIQSGQHFHGLWSRWRCDRFRHFVSLSRCLRLLVCLAVPGVVKEGLGQQGDPNQRRNRCCWCIYIILGLKFIPNPVKNEREYVKLILEKKYRYFATIFFLIAFFWPTKGSASPINKMCQLWGPIYPQKVIFLIQFFVRLVRTRTFISVDNKWDVSRSELSPLKNRLPTLRKKEWKKWKGVHPARRKHNYNYILSALPTLRKFCGETSFPL